MNAKEKLRAASNAWKKANPERRKTADRRWVKNNRESRRASCRAWRERNLEEQRARERARYHKAPEKMREANSAWYRDNPEKARAKAQKRRARLHDACSPGVSPKDWLALVALFDGKCAYCPEAGTTIDHIVPISKGGKDEIGNVFPACKPCNSSKGNKEITAWLNAGGRWRG